MAKKGFTEKDYLKIAGQKAKVAADMPLYPKILIYGRKKVGKTSLALSVGRDNILIVDPEIGSAYKRKTNPFIWPVEKWEDMQEVYGALRTGRLSPNHIKQGESSTPFKWCCLDGLTRFNEYALKFVMRMEQERDLDRQPDFVQQRDYGKSGQMMKTLLTQYHSLKMGVIYTAHERMKTTAYDEEDSDVEGTDYQLVPELPDSVRNAVNGLVDVIGRLYVVRVEDPKNAEKKVAVRRLHIGNSEVYDTGFRSEFDLPDVVRSPTIPKLRKLMKEGSQ